MDICHGYKSENRHIFIYKMEEMLSVKFRC